MWYSLEATPCTAITCWCWGVKVHSGVLQCVVYEWFVWNFMVLVDWNWSVIKEPGQCTSLVHSVFFYDTWLYTMVTLSAVLVTVGANVELSVTELKRNLDNHLHTRKNLFSCLFFFSLAIILFGQIRWRRNLFVFGFLYSRSFHLYMPRTIL